MVPEIDRNATDTTEQIHSLIMVESEQLAGSWCSSHDPVAHVVNAGHFQSAENRELSRVESLLSGSLTSTWFGHECHNLNEPECPVRGLGALARARRLRDPGPRQSSRRR